MPISPARTVAYAILLRLDSGRDFAIDLLLRSQVSDMADADRRLATEIVMGVERWLGELDFQIEKLSGKQVNVFDREVRTILRMAVYQIRFLEKVPNRAVVNDAVELTKVARKRSAAGFVNAVLRKCQPPSYRILGRDFQQLSAENLESVRRAFPGWILERWGANLESTFEPGQGAAIRLAYSSLSTPRTTLRVVDAAAKLHGMQRELESEGVTTSPCRFASAHGLTLEGGHVQTTRAYREGRVVIQDEASQLVAELVSPKPRQRILDLCAAPGMKAGQLAQMLVAGTLVACDYSARRLMTLASLLPPQVPAAVHWWLVRLDAAQPLPFANGFERILLDAPCSGTGTLARNPEIKWRLRPQDITRLADLQARMLRNALSLLTPGGRLVYATCSLEPEENEQVVETVLRDAKEFRALSAVELSALYPQFSLLFDSCGFLRTRPDLHAMDGFAAAVITREGPS